MRWTCNRAIAAAASLAESPETRATSASGAGSDFETRWVREWAVRRMVQREGKIAEITDKMVVAVIKCDKMETGETKEDDARMVVWSKIVQIAASYGGVN